MTEEMTFIYASQNLKHQAQLTIHPIQYSL